MGCLDLRKIKDPYEKLVNIYAGIEEVIEQYHPDEMAVESPFIDKDPQVMLKLGRAQGAAIIAAVQRGIPVTEYAPRKAKVAITGNGDASKEQVDNMVQSILGIDIEAEHYDATDALAIALCHHYQMKLPVGGAGNGKGSRKASSSWEQFIAANPGRINKK